MLTIAFALTPAKAYNSIIDYTPAEDRKLYHSTTRSLYLSDEGFDCQLEQIYGFLEIVAKRAQEYNWDKFDAMWDWLQQGILQVAKNDSNLDALTDS